MQNKIFNELIDKNIDNHIVHNENEKAEATSPPIKKETKLNVKVAEEYEKKIRKAINFRRRKIF